MRQYDTLGETIEKVRHEAGQSAHAGHGGDRAKVIHLINRVQTQLAVEHDWPRRQHTTRLDLIPGQHSYDLPDPLTFEGIRRITHARHGAAFELTYGIDPGKRAYLDPEAENSRRAHPRAWDYALSGNGPADRIQIWPTPQVETHIDIEGAGELLPARNDNARLAFPGDIVALYVASELLGEQGDEMAQSKRMMAESLSRNLRARQETKGNIWGLGRAYTRAKKLRYGRDYAGDV